MICRGYDSKLRKEKFIVSQCFLWGSSNAISAPRERESSCLNVDITSHENLQVKQFYNDVVWTLMQYPYIHYIPFKLHRTLKSNLIDRKK